MSGGIGMLLVGFLIGGAAASAVWAFIVVGKRRAVDAQRAERDQIMASIGETLAEADAIETNFRCGALTHEAFRRSLGDRVNAVMRQLRTNMHVLDPFFVKYAEQEAREYLRIIDNPERRRPGGIERHAAAASAVAAAPILDADESAEEETPNQPETDILPAVPSAEGFEPQHDVQTDEPADTAEGFEPQHDVQTDEPADTAEGFEPQHDVQAEEPAETAEGFEPQHDVQAEEPAEADDDFEPQHDVQAEEPADTAADFDQPHDVLEPDADEFEPAPAAHTPDAAPAPIAAEPADTADDFEPPFAPPGMDMAHQHEPPHTAPAPIASARDVADDFEPNAAQAPSAHDTTGIYIAPAPVREEELVLGESPEQANAAFAPAPIGATAFAPPAAPIQAPAPAATWGDGESIEEDFEAAFAQFEIPAAPASAAAPAAQQQHDVLTETNSIDRGAIQNAMEPPPQAPKQEHQGITGDDVADSIDSFFNLK
jgi:hypothetical protein